MAKRAKQEWPRGKGKRAQTGCCMRTAGLAHAWANCQVHVTEILTKWCLYVAKDRGQVEAQTIIPSSYQKLLNAWLDAANLITPLHMIEERSRWRPDMAKWRDQEPSQEWLHQEIKQLSLGCGHLANDGAPINLMPIVVGYSNYHAPSCNLDKGIWLEVL